MKKVLLFSMMTLATCCGALAQNVTIPDAEFKSRLLAHGYSNTSPGVGVIDINADGEIQVSEASAYTGTISIPYIPGAPGASIPLSDVTGIEAFLAFTALNSMDQPISSMDLSQNSALEELDCRNNALTSLDVSQNLGLTRLVCMDNTLSSLNITPNVALTELFCNNCVLTSLNVANGNNMNFVNFSALNNPNLSCIQVDDVTYCNTNWTLIDPSAGFNTECCFITIPDANFKAYLIGHLGININGDSEIQCSEASSFSGMIDCAGSSITDMTGIEAFANLTSLSCGYNQFTSLDVTQNLNLLELNCFSGNLTSLDVSQNTALTILSFGSNSITGIDLTQNTTLQNLVCSYNPLTTLDVTQNTNLNILNCTNLSLVVLDLSNNTVLEELHCGFSSLISLDLSQNIILMTVDCGGNELTSLELSNNPDLYSLTCSQNFDLNNLTMSSVNVNAFRASYTALTSLNLSNQPNLDFIEVTDNTSLSELNIANGNNQNISYFNAMNSSSLTCIQVDDAAWSTTNWPNIDAIASFYIDCGWVGLNEQNDMSVLRVFPNPTTGILNVIGSNGNSVIIDITGKIVLENETVNNQIDVSPLQNGIYILQLITEKGVVSKRFVKE